MINIDIESSAHVMMTKQKHTRH